MDILLREQQTISQKKSAKHLAMLDYANSRKKRLQISRRQHHPNATRHLQLNKDQKVLHPPSSILLTTRTRARTRACTIPVHNPIIPNIRVFPARDELLPGTLGLILDILA
jgi:hypothetical protein